MWCDVKIIHKRWFNLTIMMIVDLTKIEKRIKLFDFTTIIILDLIQIEKRIQI